MTKASLRIHGLLFDGPASSKFRFAQQPNDSNIPILSRYISRRDGSPLMDSLVHWRTSALQKRASGDAMRPVSPPPTEDDIATPPPEFEFAEPIEHKAHTRARSEPPSTAERRRAEEEDRAADQESGSQTTGTGTAKKPTSSSWVQWWSRSRKNNTVSTPSPANGQPVSVL